MYEEFKSLPLMESHINFDMLHIFTGGNTEFSKTLLLAFVAEMEIFIAKILHDPTEEAFISFRKSHHSISPSLQMLGLDNISLAVDDYKAAYANKKENLSEKADKLLALSKASVDEANEWIEKKQ
jgi:HPt (histidine-containing phosphotransfer) domain-containing protein